MTSLTDKPESAGGFASVSPEGGLDLTTLFYEPGKAGYVSPREGDGSAYRLAVFRNVGRVVGLCLLHKETIPISFSRHVLKFLLGRQIAWHDLAFFSPTLFEQFRNMLCLADRLTDSEFESSGCAVDMYFVLTPPFKRQDYELLPNGANIPVTRQNVRHYVILYAQYVMVECCRRALGAMACGLHDVVPESTLSVFTAEDLRLMLNGLLAVDLNMLRTCTVFEKTEGHREDEMERTRKWFWAVVQKMTDEERHDLLYFWTSSPSLPSTDINFSPKILVRPASEFNLPTANTCALRLEIPLYSSKELLREKLLFAIKTKEFGFV